MAGTKRSKIRKNDQVVIIAGRDKGKRGRVLEVSPGEGKVKVEGAGMIKRHQKANPQASRGFQWSRNRTLKRIGNGKVKRAISKGRSAADCEGVWHQQSDGRASHPE